MCSRLQPYCIPGAVDRSKFKHQTVNLFGVGIWGVDLPQEVAAACTT